MAANHKLGYMVLYTLVFCNTHLKRSVRRLDFVLRHLRGWDVEI